MDLNGVGGWMRGVGVLWLGCIDDCWCKLIWENILIRPILGRFIVIAYIIHYQPGSTLSANGSE